MRDAISRHMGRSLLAACAILMVACVPVRRMPLSQPVDATAGAVAARASSVSASAAFLSQRGGGPSVVAVTLSARNDGTDGVFLELERASLALVDPASELEEVTLVARASGSGSAPDAIDLLRPPAPVALAPGETAAIWVAFRAETPLADADLPRRIRLRIPVRNASAPLDLIVAEPSTGRPRWVHPPIRTASYAGISAIGTPFDEGSIGILRTSSKSVAGPIVLGPSIDLGLRAGSVRGERERTIVCCDLGLSFDLSIIALEGRRGSFGPYVSYQGVFALESGRTDKAAWHGPAVGLQFFTRLIDPIVAGALPVRSSPTPLGYSSVTVAYVHLFRRGDSGGSPGMLLLFEHTLPEL
jgi:hypothetical protein